MIALSAILHAMLFVTDCDKTLVHYGSDDLIPENLLITLPASSGSGKIGFISHETVNLLDSIATHVPIVCASGMRASTMLQRRPYLKAVSFWICENGGRIFESCGDGVVEISEWPLSWRPGLSHVAILKEFAETLESEGWDVDSSGYKTMIRVCGEDVDSIVSRIPASLGYTFNLGHLDIQLPGICKLSATRWLMHFLRHRNSMDSKPNVNDFVFMGDDTNDIKIAAAANIALIASPCSEDMQTWVESQTESTTGDECIGLATGTQCTQITRINSNLYTAAHQRHEGTESLLRFALKLLGSSAS